MENLVNSLLSADGFNALISFLVATLFKLPFKEDYRIYVRIFIEICRHTNMYSVIMS